MSYHIWYHMPSIKTTVYLDSADYRALQAHAEVQGRSAAELIREAVRHLVAQHAGRTPSNRVAEATPYYAARAERTASGSPQIPSAPLPSIADRLAEIQAMVREMPILDARPADEILGYDADGLPR